MLTNVMWWIALLLSASGLVWGAYSLGFWTFLKKLWHVVAWLVPKRPAFDANPREDVELIEDLCSCLQDVRPERLFTKEVLSALSKLSKSPGFEFLVELTVAADEYALGDISLSKARKRVTARTGWCGLTSTAKNCVHS